MTILYGSNAGTCEALATSVASTASNHGVSPQVMSLDTATGNLPKGHPVLIITSSYEGEPPDNACQFVEWLKGLHKGDLQDVHFAVFGCGNRKYFNPSFKPILTESR